MRIGTTIVDYIMTVCKDMNKHVLISRNYIVYKRSKNKADKRSVDNVIKNNAVFKTENEIIDYYNKKVIQIKEYWNDLKESDRILAFTDSDACRSIFKDIIQDDSKIIKKDDKNG